MNQSDCSLRLVSARYRLELETPESLQALGEKLLISGNEIPSVIALAAANELVMTEMGPLFEQVIADLGIRIPEYNESIDIAIAGLLEDVVYGRIQPNKGVNWLVLEIYNPHIAELEAGKIAGSSKDLQAFIAAYWMYDELQNEPNAPMFTFEAVGSAVGEKAKQLLDCHVCEQARHWLCRHCKGVFPAEVET